MIEVSELCQQVLGEFMFEFADEMTLCRIQQYVSQKLLEETVYYTSGNITEIVKELDIYYIDELNGRSLGFQIKNAGTISVEIDIKNHW